MSSSAGYSGARVAFTAGGFCPKVRHLIEAKEPPLRFRPSIVLLHVAAMLVGWLTSPGEVSLEYATEIAADLGTLTAGLHAAVADGRGLPEMAPREATRAEVRSWAAASHQHLARALDVATGEARSLLRDLASRIAESISVIDALPTAPEVIRAHGDYHLGQVLIAADGFRVVDFEGEPLTPAEARRAHRPALRDVASMLRSIDHVARSARRRAFRRRRAGLLLTSNDRPRRTPMLDIAHKNSVNGIDLDALAEATEAIAGDGARGIVAFRVRTEWTG